MQRTEMIHTSWRS